MKKLLAILLLFSTATYGDLSPGKLGRTWTLNSSTDSVGVTGSITAVNASVGPLASPVPSMATFVGFQDTSGNLAPVVLTTSGAIPVQMTPVTISSAVITQVATSTGTSVPLLSSDSTRNSFILFNISSGYNCYVAFSATASPSSFTFLLPQGATFIMDNPAYQGAVSAYCNTGSISVTSM